MAQTSQPAPQFTPQPVTRQDANRKSLLLAALIIMVFILLLTVLPWIVTMISYTNLPAPSPNANVTLGQLQNLSSRANQQLQQSNNLLTLVTSFATVMAVVLAVFTVITIGLGALGIITNNGFRDLEDKWRLGLASVEELQERTREKGNAIDKLEEEMSQKQQNIEKLQGEITLKQQNIDELQTTLKTLGENMKDEVDAVKKQFEKTNRALTLLILGNQLLEQRRREEALEYYEKAQELVPNDPQINYTLGRAYSSVKAYDKAIQFLDLATSIDQNFHQAQMELGLAYRRRGNQQYEEAELEKDDAKQKTLYSHARADYQQAIRHLENAIGIQPDYEDALATLGGLYRRLGDYEHNTQDYHQALEFYEKATKADPNSSYALGNFASLSWFFGNKEQAIIAFASNKDIAIQRITRLVRAAEIYWDYYDLGLAQLVLGEFEEAKRSYTEAIKKTPGLVDFEGVLSNLYLLNKASDRISGLEEIITLVKDAEDTKRKAN
ncbi:MAG TPA: tetratricopeptide repeat protein [Ktedonobacteraceae bacterium]|nr:tetratricopeptide repeat protein [Ktedonobacteraceae bacterium]